MQWQNCLLVFAMLDVFSDGVLCVHCCIGGAKENVAATGHNNCKSDRVGERFVVAETKRNISSTASEKNEKVIQYRYVHIHSCTAGFCSRLAQLDCTQLLNQGSQKLSKSSFRIICTQSPGKSTCGSTYMWQYLYTMNCSCMCTHSCIQVLVYLYQVLHTTCSIFIIYVVHVLQLYILDLFSSTGKL